MEYKNYNDPLTGRFMQLSYAQSYRHWIEPNPIIIDATDIKPS